MAYEPLKVQKGCEIDFKKVFLGLAVLLVLAEIIDSRPLRELLIVFQLIIIGIWLKK